MIHSSGSIDMAFKAQVLRTPEAIALTQNGRHMTYDHLDRASTALAYRLIESGVTTEATVGIFLERGIEMVVAMIAALKAGGAYVPLDPIHPAARLEHIIADSAPAAIITDTSLRAKLPASYEGGIFSYGTGEVCCLLDIEAGRYRSSGRNLAYVIYTSGSTGEPKGVMVEHSSVLAFVSNIQGLIRPTERDTWLLAHSFSFDFSVLELWGCLLFGGRLVISSYQTVRTPSEFFELLCNERVTVVSQTPSAFRQLVAARELSSARHCLRTIVLGGEALEMRPLRQWQQLHGASGPLILNMYGPTETTVFVTAKSLTEKDALSVENSSPIGTAMEGVNIHLLDSNLREAPNGAAGEIFIGGSCVARGYWKRPQLTADRFLANLSAVEGATRMYRSGDRGRQHCDGQLEYMGRRDAQIKLRGFRVELGDIEANLYAHEDVSQAVVVLREDAPGDACLVAYFTSCEGQTPTTASLRAFLGDRLPEYMIPTDFVALDKLPLSPNGKIDRLALPKPSIERFVAENEQPEGEIERVLAVIWKELLRVERVSREDNFFARGGSSLLGMSLVDHVRNRFRVDPGAAFVFQYPTIRTMAACIKEHIVFAIKRSKVDTSPEQLDEGYF